MLPFNGSCFRVLQFNYSLNKKRERNPEISLYTAPFIILALLACSPSTGQKKGQTLKNNQTKAAPLFLYFLIIYSTVRHSIVTVNKKSLSI